MSEGLPVVELSPAARRTLAKIADQLIPGEEGVMPLPSSLDIGGAQLDAVLAARSDIAETLARALAAAAFQDDAAAFLDELRTTEPEGWEAVVVAVVGGYYLHPEVRRALGYPGQTPEPVNVGDFPDYVSEGLLERVFERGPRYRPTPNAAAG